MTCCFCNWLNILCHHFFFSLFSCKLFDGLYLIAGLRFIFHVVIIFNLIFLSWFGYSLCFEESIICYQWRAFHDLHFNLVHLLTCINRYFVDILAACSFWLDLFHVLLTHISHFVFVNPLVAFHILPLIK